MTDSATASRKLTAVAGASAILLTLAVALFFCGPGDSHRGPAPSQGGTATEFPAAVASAPSNPPPRPHSGYISQLSWANGPWPFTVADGIVTCVLEWPVQVHTFTSNSASYALNYAAQATGRYRPVDTIWRQDPSNPGFKISLASIVDYARVLCTR
jgi:Protein of unknown function (DUF2511)